MEEVTFKESTIFDRKVRKPGDTLMVSEGEAENLRRIGVVAEKGGETEAEHGNLEDLKTAETEPEVESETSNKEEAESEPEPENKMPQPLQEKAPKPKKKYSMKKKKSGK